MSTDATLIEGHEHIRIEINEGCFMMVWPEGMSDETTQFLEHVFIGIMTRQRNKLKLTDLDKETPPERFRS